MELISLDGKTFIEKKVSEYLKPGIMSMHDKQIFILGAEFCASNSN